MSRAKDCAFKQHHNGFPEKKKNCCSPYHYRQSHGHNVHHLYHLEDGPRPKVGLIWNGYCNLVLVIPATCRKSPCNPLGFASQMVIFSEMGGHWHLLCAIIQQLFLADWHHNYWHSNSQPDLWAKFLLPPSLQKRVCPLPNQDRSEVWFCDRHELSIVSAGCSTQWAGCEMKTLGYCSGWFLASLLCCHASSFQVFCLCLKFGSEIATRICVDPWSPWSKQKKMENQQ